MGRIGCLGEWDFVWVWILCILRSGVKRIELEWMGLRGLDSVFILRLV